MNINSQGARNTLARFWFTLSVRQNMFKSYFLWLVQHCSRRPLVSSKVQCRFQHVQEIVISKQQRGSLGSRSDQLSTSCGMVTDSRGGKMITAGLRDGVNGSICTRLRLSVRSCSTDLDIR